MPEPITIESVTVQVDSGPLIAATLKIVPSRTSTQVTFHASAQVSGGQDPHAVTVVATNDQGLRATKTVRVFTGAAFEVDNPALLLERGFRCHTRSASPGPGRIAFLRAIDSSHNPATSGRRDDSRAQNRSVQAGVDD